jgi:hypothetical protein
LEVAQTPQEILKDTAMEIDNFMQDDLFPGLQHNFESDLIGRQEGKPQKVEENLDDDNFSVPFTIVTGHQGATISTISKSYY